MRQIATIKHMDLNAIGFKFMVSKPLSLQLTGIWLLQGEIPMSNFFFDFVFNSKINEPTHIHVNILGLNNS